MSIEWAAWYDGWPVTKAEGPGRGWWGPPKGTHTGGEQGKATKGLTSEIRQRATKDISQIQQYGIESGKEAATAIDIKGNRIDGFSKGDEASVDLSELVTGKEHVIIHNHPGNASFSDDDIALLFTTKAKHLVVIGNDGTLYRLSNTMNVELPRWGKKYPLKFVQGRWREQVKGLRPKFNPKVESGELSKSAAWKEHSHLATLETAKVLGLDYERILP